MNKDSASNLHKLMDTESQQMARLHRIIEQTVEEESLISQKVYEENELQKLTFGERVADRVAEFGGSWTFIILFGIILFVWILLNTIILANRAYDPYPFILLNLILSCIAALQAPIIMMSQNRQEVKDRARAENDYLVNLKAEIEVRHLHEKIDLLMQEQNMQLFEIQRQQLEKLEHLEAELRKLKKEQ